MGEDLYKRAYKKLCEDEILKEALENGDIAILDIREFVIDAVEDFKDKSEYAVLERLTDLMDSFATEVVYNKYYEIYGEDE